MFWPAWQNAPDGATLWREKPKRLTSGVSKPVESVTVNSPSDAQISVIAETYRLLGDPTRLRVLLACLSAPIAVGDIARTVNASPSLVSHHLRLLRSARLVRGTRRNRQVFYETADEHIARMLADMIEHAMEEQGEASDT